MTMHDQKITDAYDEWTLQCPNEGTDEFFAICDKHDIDPGDLEDAIHEADLQLYDQMEVRW